MNRFVIAEPKRCIGCNTCMAACTQVHRRQGLQTHPRLTVERDLAGTAPVLCRHCEDAPCARVCPVNAITHQDQAVVLNENTCIGCKLCAIACPFGAITPSGSKPPAIPETFSQNIPLSLLSDVPCSISSINPLLSWNAGVRSVAVKCDLCAFQEKGPECVRVCPTKALFIVDDRELERLNAEKRRHAMEWPAGNRPFPPDAVDREKKL
ncbi:MULTISPECIES: 4Fe-4S dicluster domain-containing protein [Brenneria]|uniref:4Fe-4S dicluster domain-containing protein n=1 Tax=Brenneria nigrifluens DSM 30175 = ATCC 13028 TaxID=1121120 RepID=A0A2U1UR00_9GAMM|nr:MULTISPECIES: 4Fe-4S dicluster domain-containing protein [Brenneria]EHD22278.1 4Fe-4S ferredoxin iron-sulfur binding domain-containing protein [Brenneria sp. EniD312]PWC24105.1 4Fe-4S dicluster domain-containing protein [Brenneria nigrifluens DSM 30175 = ATCC 13028]QCR05298.1 4Fe-4S dicluster domain-containing protein [Brenneria nigrifluens DSM 30175 = ATCC 13028]